jgi:hypothetical protein
MSRFEMTAHKPQEIEFELRVTMTLKDWMVIREALAGTPLYGPTGWLKEAIIEMTRQANETYRAYPEETCVEPPK